MKKKLLSCLLLAAPLLTLTGCNNDTNVNKPLVKKGNEITRIEANALNSELEAEEESLDLSSGVIKFSIDGSGTGLEKLYIGLKVAYDLKAKYIQQDAEVCLNAASVENKTEYTNWIFEDNNKIIVATSTYVEINGESQESKTYGELPLSAESSYFGEMDFSEFDNTSYSTSSIGSLESLLAASLAGQIESGEVKFYANEKERALTVEFDTEDFKGEIQVVKGLLVYISGELETASYSATLKYKYDYNASVSVKTPDYSSWIRTTIF